MGRWRAKAGDIRAGRRPIIQNGTALYPPDGVGLSRAQQPDAGGRCAMGDVGAQCDEPVLDRQFAAHRIALPRSGDIDRQPATGAPRQRPSTGLRDGGHLAGPDGYAGLCDHHY